MNHRRIGIALIATESVIEVRDLDTLDRQASLQPTRGMQHGHTVSSTGNGEQDALPRNFQGHEFPMEIFLKHKYTSLLIVSRDLMQNGFNPGLALVS